SLDGGREKARGARRDNAQEVINQEPELREETEWASLPNAPLPDDEDEEEETPVAPMQATANAELEESIRELVLWSRTIIVPVLVTETAATWEEFHSADLGNVMEQFQKELQVSKAEPYKMLRTVAIRYENFDFFKGIACTCHQYTLSVFVHC
uniref:Ras-GEF domain-containing protein n=1 Tax=Elaeophora elaphi TaxID=1147741 RepID=A0A0R3RTA1_9BILA